MSTRCVLLIIMLAIFAGCSRGPERAQAIGEGYVAPMTLNVREELAPRAASVATVKHGDRLEILQTRRRFARVRAPNGTEGWIDGRQLMTVGQMEGLRQRGIQYAKAPSMGAATVHEALNIHTEPYRQAPSFHQIPEQGKVDVLERRLAPRVPYEPPSVIPPPKPPAPKKTKERKKDAPKIPNPPMPPAPGLPADWLEISETDFEEQPLESAEQPQTSEAASAPEKPALRMDDWSLVRTREGRVGWVLTGALIMAIPDEVAQYAEGHRITSYFSLGKVEDDGETKHTWLWTTLSESRQPYDFDGFRVFVYNTRRNRYETAYIERNLKGYYPVEAFPRGLNGSGAPAFSLIFEDKEGQAYKRTYEFQGYRVRMISKEPWASRSEPEAKPASVNVASAQNEKSVFGRIKEKIFGR